MPSPLAFEDLFKFERELAAHCGSPWAVMTDCCTHAIELCMRYDKVGYCGFTAKTYLSIPMLMHKLGIVHYLLDEPWLGEYAFHGTRIWDSARLLRPGMYRSGYLQCLSFGHGKPLDIGHGGAVLTDDAAVYETLSRWRSDGRDLRVSPWENQKVFDLGFHYRPTLEDARRGSELLPNVNPEPKYHEYPDCRNLIITY